MFRTILAFSFVFLQAKSYLYFPRFSKPDVWLDHIIRRENIGEQLNNTFASQNKTGSPNRITFIDDNMISDYISINNDDPASA